ncbi:hypothetical protein FHX73_113824 [Kitasatospora viridis]|uniref:Uncharacterized protein n=1 Tax=Kitasatospora viridis TaxID=281105 RepID=A0A561UKR8_9ACTN|nr:hypothetical protein FHX73_113824 [Kitasatospora viridis]
MVRHCSQDRIYWVDRRRCDKFTIRRYVDMAIWRDAFDHEAWHPSTPLGRGRVARWLVAVRRAGPGGGPLPLTGAVASEDGQPHGGVPKLTENRCCANGARSASVRPCEAPGRRWVAGGVGAGWGRGGERVCRGSVRGGSGGGVREAGGSGSPDRVGVSRGGGACRVAGGAMGRPEPATCPPGRLAALCCRARVLDDALDAMSRWSYFHCGRGAEIQSHRFPGGGRGCGRWAVRSGRVSGSPESRMGRLPFPGMGLGRVPIRTPFRGLLADCLWTACAQAAAVGTLMAGTLTVGALTVGALTVEVARARSIASGRLAAVSVGR